MAEAALFVLVQIPFGVDVDPVDNNTNMQMIPGHIAGSADLGNGVVLVYRIASGVAGIGESVTVSFEAIAIAVGILSPVAGTGMASASLVPAK